MGISSTSPLQLESYDINFDAATGISSNSVALTNVTNVSGVGVLNSIGIAFNTSSPTGNWSGQLEIQIDGSTTRVLTIWVVGVPGTIRPFATHYGTSMPFNFLIPIGARFASSCRVGINVTVANPGVTIDCTVVRGVAL